MCRVRCTFFSLITCSIGVMVWALSCSIMQDSILLVWSWLYLFCNFFCLFFNPRCWFHGFLHGLYLAFMFCYLGLLLLSLPFFAISGNESVRGKGKQKKQQQQSVLKKKVTMNRIKKGKTDPSRRKPTNYIQGKDQGQDATVTLVSRGSEKMKKPGCVV